MKKLAFAAALLAATAMTVPAFAQEGFNASVGYTHFDGEDVQVGGITGRLGYRFHPNFGVEGEATFGVKDDDVDTPFGTANVELDNAWGLYGVAYAPLSENLDLFGRVGYANVEANASIGGATVGLDEDGVGFGGGIQWRPMGTWGIRAEYTRLEGEDDGVDTFGLGIATQF
jgi:outer membrane immunogenic protein